MAPRAVAGRRAPVARWAAWLAGTVAALYPMMGAASPANFGGLPAVANAAALYSSVDGAVAAEPLGSCPAAAVQELKPPAILCISPAASAAQDFKVPCPIASFKGGLANTEALSCTEPLSTCTCEARDDASCAGPADTDAAQVFSHLTAETAPENAPEPPPAVLPQDANLLPAPAQMPHQAMVLHLLRPPQPGQLLVAALYAGIDCGRGLQVHWQGRLYTAHAVKDGWKHVLLPVSVTTAPGHYSLTAICSAESGQTHAVFTLELGPGTFAESRLHVAPKFTGAPPKRAAPEHHAIEVAFAHSAHTRLWTQRFGRPTAGVTTSPFGVRRTFNGKLKSRHLGEDFDGRVGDGVWAANDGIVALAANNYFFTGNAVFIDHGESLYTLYFHMTKLHVKTGEHVVRGQLIGNLGGTGRVTGPHVHFGVKLSGTYVNPADLLQYDPRLPLGPGAAPQSSMPPALGR